MAYICLSYTPASRNLAEQVHRRLETNDFRVWRREPDLIYADASSAAILDAAFKGAAAFVFVWSEGETVPTYLTEDYHVARTFKRPIYFVNQIGQIEQLITALRQTFPTVDSFGPLPVLALDQPAHSDDIDIERSSQLIRLLSIGAAGLGLLTV
ncbi:MAG: toll/interleukin-1 receptor domain-containing protein, partial [Anaerolinea sp.]|nr:toll/interleukin-1 receptor domain-containing protein [Anaerolinea sp.]